MKFMIPSIRIINVSNYSNRRVFVYVFFRKGLQGNYAMDRYS